MREPDDKLFDATVSSIRCWPDVSFDIKQPAIAGVPAPELTSDNQIYGFSPFQQASVPATETSWQSDAELDHSVANTTESDGTGVVPLERDSSIATHSKIEERSDRLPDELDSNAAVATETLARPLELDASPSVSDIVLRESHSPRLTIALTAPASNGINHTILPTMPWRAARHASAPSASPLLGMDDYQSPLTQNGSGFTGLSTPVVASQAGNFGRVLSPLSSPTWPTTRRLNDQLDLLCVVANDTPIRYRGMVASWANNSKLKDKDIASAKELVDWSAEVQHALESLNAVNRLGAPEVKILLDDLGALHQAASQRAETLSDRSERVAWIQAAYAVERRLAIWQPIHLINAGIEDSADDSEVSMNNDIAAEPANMKTALAAIEALSEGLNRTDDSEGWREFLALDQLAEAFESGNEPDCQSTSQCFLSRVQWPGLSKSQENWLRSKPVNEVATAVLPWAAGAIDYAALLHQIEKAETNAIDLVTSEIAHSMQSLRYAAHPQAKTLAQNINTHYRNANVRVSIAANLANHLLPKLPLREVPVRTTLLGSRVTGISQVKSDLKIRLRPSPDSWDIRLETIGQVSTRSVGRRGPAAVSTDAINPFVAEIPIEIKPTDIALGEAEVDVEGQSRLRDIDTDFDGWPLLGTLAQRIVETEYFDKASLANRIGRNRIRSQVGGEIDRTIHEKVDQASGQFSETVLGPLTRLKLAPQVIDMSSSPERLVARYRMAGDWQLAAMTPRPRAMSNNLFSIQVHQSAINNTLEQLVPQNELMPIAELMAQCVQLLGFEEPALPADIPDDTSIQFAKHRPVTIEIADGKVWVTMRIIRLQREGGLQLRNFIVRGAYKPQISGLDLALVRDGVLSISGPRMSMRQRLPARAIFNKVLSPNRPLHLADAQQLASRLPENQTITQCELRDGWIGISVGETEEELVIARRPSGIR